MTAVGATVCRHYVISHLLDISTGERYIYACVMLYMLMVHFYSAWHVCPLHYYATGLIASTLPLSDIDGQHAHTVRPYSQHTSIACR